MPTGFEPRMGVSWFERGCVARYGVIIGCDDDTVDVVEALPLSPGIHCYDEGLDYARDHDNVRLDDAPPPFAFLCIREGTAQCYTFAQVNTPLSFQGEELDMLTVTDGGEKVSEKDFDTIFNHPWPEQPQKEFTPGRTEPEAKPELDNKRYRQSMTAFSSLMAAVSEPEDEHEEDEGPDFW